MHLTETHRALLRAAACHPDGLLTRPDRLVGAALRRMAARLTELGVAEEVAASPEGPRWGKDGAGAPTGLRITEAGRTAIGPPEDLDAGGGDDAAASLSASEDAGPAGPKPAGAPQPGSKRALLLDLVGRDGGATLDRLTAALGWQAHTVRAALTRLRQEGVTIERARDESGRSAYRRGGADASGRPGSGGEPA